LRSAKKGLAFASLFSFLATSGNLASTLQNSFTIVIPLHISGLRAPLNISSSRRIAVHMQEIPRWN
jgi:hypothetical protein